MCIRDRVYITEGNMGTITGVISENKSFYVLYDSNVVVVKKDKLQYHVTSETGHQGCINLSGKKVIASNKGIWLLQAPVISEPGCYSVSMVINPVNLNLAYKFYMTRLTNKPMNNKSMEALSAWNFSKRLLTDPRPVSYTHLTLPTIYSV